jgi:hypothetical protein
MVARRAIVAMTGFGGFSLIAAGAALYSFHRLLTSLGIVESAVAGLCAAMVGLAVRGTWKQRHGAASIVLPLPGPRQRGALAVGGLVLVAATLGATLSRRLELPVLALAIAGTALVALALGAIVFSRQ